MRKRWPAALLTLLIMLMLFPAQADPVAVDSLQMAEMLSGNGFMVEGTDPIYYKNHAEGHWLYVSDTVRV